MQCRSLDRLTVNVDMFEPPILEQLPPIDKRDPLPRHIQVQRTLRDLVTTGKLQPGDKIPAEVDIASALGVSKMTVNKALLALTADGLFVREVGRGTFVAPQSPGRSPTSRIILTFVEGARNVLDSDYYGTLYRGIIEYLTTHHQRVSLELSLSGTLQETTPSDDIIGHLVIAPRQASLPTLLRCWERGQALVVIGASWPSLVIPTIDSDNAGGAALAVQYLIQQGHRRIALLFAEEETANTRDRIQGYRQAITRAGLPLDPGLEICSLYSWEIGEEAHERMTALLTGNTPATAIFAAGHYLALEAKNVVRAAGLRIPEDVSVVGFDDPVSAQLVHPPLTTVRQPLYEMGRRAAERLLRLMRKEDLPTPVREVLPPELILRASAGPPPSTKIPAN